MNKSASLELLLLAAIWGASFMFMRVASPEFGPVLLMALRTTIACLFLVPLMLAKKQFKACQGHYQQIFIAGLLSTAIPFVCYGYATLSLSAGISSILNATTPMFGALVAYFWLKDKLTKSAIAGLVIGFVGVYLLVFDKIHLSENTSLLPVAVILLATLCYGIAANYTKKRLSGLPTMAIAAGSQVAASIILLPLSLAFIPEQLPSSQATISLIILGLVCTGIAYILYFRLISNVGPNKAMSVTYLIPVFGVFWGYLILSEQLNLWMLLGSSFILFGVGLTTGVLKPEKIVARVSRSS